MLKEIYIDNYKTLVNFRLKLDTFQLILGENGTGKTSTLEVLSLLQDIMNGAEVGEKFDNSTFTIWHSDSEKKEQKIELQMDIEGEAYRYTLLVEKRRNKRDGHDDRVIRTEELLWNNQRFYYFDGNEVHLFRINWDTNKAEEGVCFPGDWSRSFLSQVGDRDDNKPISLFRQELKNYMLIRPYPILLSQEAKNSSPNLEPLAKNFAAWFYHLLLDSPLVWHQANTFLKDVFVDRYRSLSLKESGDLRRLYVSLSGNNDLDFSQLSDGQRQLVLLYTLLAYIKEGASNMLFLDEPDNFVTLREIAPWWQELNELSEMPGKQIILISHHPTIVDQMGHDQALWFSRPEGWHTVVTPYQVTDGLTPAETMERGWDNE